MDRYYVNIITAGADFWDNAFRGWIYEHKLKTNIVSLEQQSVDLVILP